MTVLGSVAVAAEQQRESTLFTRQQYLDTGHATKPNKQMDLTVQLVLRRPETKSKIRK